MALNQFTNNASTTLASAIDSSVTSLTVAAGTGALFPTLAGSNYFYTTLSNLAGTIIEIVKVTARSTDTFTIVRGQDNTTATSFSSGDKVELRLTAADLNNFPQLDSTNTFAQIQTFTSGVSLGVDLPVAEGGTGASTADTARNNLVAARSGSNTDITSLSGLTTPLSAGQGGTGANSLVNAGIDLTTFTTTPTAAATTTLLSTSNSVQFFTGTTTQTIVLPVASTMVLGQRFTIHNNSTGTLTINSSGANLVGTVTANTTSIITCISTSGTSAASWDFDITGFTTALPINRGGTGLTTLGTANQVLAVNSGATALEFQTVAAGGTGTPWKNRYFGSSVTYSPTTGAAGSVKYVFVGITGAGGGGGGGSSAGFSGGGAGSVGNAGNASSFGSFMTGNGGGGGNGATYWNGSAGNTGNNGNVSYGAGLDTSLVQGYNQTNGTNGIVSYSTYVPTGNGGSGGGFTYQEEQGQGRRGGDGGQGGRAFALINATQLGTNVSFTAGNAGNGGASSNGNYNPYNFGPGQNGQGGGLLVCEFFS
jgi:hypothetical protein